MECVGEDEGEGWEGEGKDKGVAMGKCEDRCVGEGDGEYEGYYVWGVCEGSVCWCYGM